MQIKIEDVDEFEVAFDRSDYKIPLDAAAPAGTIIGIVHATDRDYNDRNGNLTYRAISGNALGIVRLSRDGQLSKNAHGYAFDRNQQYTMIVQASGRGNKVVSRIVRAHESKETFMFKRDDQTVDLVTDSILS